MDNQDSNQTPHWERGLLEKLAFANLAEQRSARTWRMIFWSLILLLLFGILFSIIGMLSSGKNEKASRSNSDGHTAVVDLRGVISAESAASAENVMQGLRDAFDDKGTKGVIIRANSPGGSPVQSAYINDEIVRLRKLYPEIPVYTVVEDICASGCYYAAAASDKIYVNKGSLIGSIGVLMDGFGFTGTMEKLGVERRLITAGSNKGFLDPFSPMNAEQQAYAKQMLAEIHAQFIAVVKEGRGKRLKATTDTFSGLVWNGARGVEMGLADGFGSVDSVARDVIKAERIENFSAQEDFSQRIAKQLGATARTEAEATMTRSLR